MRQWYVTTCDKFWITKCDRMGYNATWIAKCDKMVYKVQQELKSETGLQKEMVQSLPYIYTSHCTVCYFKMKKMKKVFLIIGKILSEYITEDMIRDIFMIIFLTNVPLNFYNTLLIKTHPSWIHINTTFSCFWLSGELSFKKTFYRFIFHWSFC